MELTEIKDNDCLIISDFEKCPEFFEIMDISDPSLKEIFFSDYNMSFIVIVFIGSGIKSNQYFHITTSFTAFIIAQKLLTWNNNCVIIALT